MDEIKIVVGGRIPKYFFATLNEDFRNELSEALRYCSEEIESEQDFLNLILDMTLENSEQSREDFFKIISNEDLKRLPNFNKLVDDIITYDWNHFELLDSEFFEIPNWNGGYLTMFEGDAHITIWKNEEKIVDEVRLDRFSEKVAEWHTDDHQENQDLTSLRIMKDLMFRNKEHFDGSDYFGWGRNQEGCFFLEGYFNPPAFNEFIEQSRINNEYNTGGQLSIYFDDYADWTFYITTENFEMKDLTFVNWSTCEQFRNSAFPCKFVELYYKGGLVYPEENWYRDKGISLSYEDETLDMLVNI
jgi:hypothetical protein